MPMFARASDRGSRWLRLSFRAVIAAAVGVSAASAFEPPRPSVEDALSGGRVAFVARVQQQREIERRPTHAVARAELVVLKCLYGRPCRSQPTVQLLYTSDTVQERALGVNFALGREYLLVFRQPRATRGPLIFGSDWSSNMDVAFVLRTPLQPLTALGIEAGPVTFENVWGGPPQQVERSRLEAWAARRELELSRLR